METNNSRSSLPVLQLQPTLKPKPVQTILKSSAAMSAKLELADVYSVKQDLQLLGKKRLQNEKPVSASSTSKSYSKFTGRQETETHDGNPMNFSFIYDQTSGMENISADDINVSILAHDGSEISSDPSFNGLQSQDERGLRSKQIPRYFTEKMQNNTDAQSGPEPLPSTQNDQINIDFLTSSHTAILAELSASNNKTEEKAQDNKSSNEENSFELSFDESRGQGAVFSSGVLTSTSPDLFPDDHNTIPNHCDNENRTFSCVSTCSSESDLVIDLNYKGAETKSGAASYSPTTTTTPDSTPTVTCNNGSGIVASASTAVAAKTGAAAEINSCGPSPKTKTNTFDLDLTNLALAKRGNPENLYGLLAGFITTGKKSRNPITINLHQCYNCDGTCVRNTIAVSSSSSSKPLKVTTNGIEIPKTPSELQPILNSQNSNNLNSAITSAVDPCNIIKPATFSPYNQISSSSKSSSTLVEPERLLTTPFLLPCQSQTSQIDVLNQSAQSNAKNRGKNNTFLVSNLTDLDGSNFHDRYVNSANAEHNNNNSTFVVRNSSFHDQMQIHEGEHEQHFSTVVDSEISPITKPASKMSDSGVSVIVPKLRIKPSSMSKRKRGVKRSKRRVLKTKHKKIKVQSNSTLDSASAATVIQGQQVVVVETNNAVPGGLLVDSTPDSLAAPLLSPHTSDVSPSSPKNQNSDDAEIEEGTVERASDEEDLSTNYLDMYNSTTRKNTKNPKVATIEYSCRKCSFRTMSSVTVDRKLKNHFKRHQRPSQFECLYCCKQYSAISSRTRHILTCRKNPNRNSLQGNQMQMRENKPSKASNSIRKSKSKVKPH